MKSRILLLSILIAAGPSLLAEVDTGRPSAIPYDRYLSPVREVFARGGGSAASIDEVRSELRTARRFRYYYNSAEPYTPQSPAITESKKQGDCKAKSLWLGSKMSDRSWRYVIGKAKPGDKMSHAWLLWSNGGTWLFLDPTMESDVVYADRVTGRKLVPQYSCGSSSSYSHPSYSEYVK